jgi:hypothetical protein
MTEEKLPVVKKNLRFQIEKTHHQVLGKFK